MTLGSKVASAWRAARDALARLNRLLAETGSSEMIWSSKSGAAKATGETRIGIRARLTAKSDKPGPKTRSDVQTEALWVLR